MMSELGCDESNLSDSDRCAVVADPCEAVEAPVTLDGTSCPTWRTARLSISWRRRGRRWTGLRLQWTGVSLSKRQNVALGEDTFDLTVKARWQALLTI
ncbi:hypothetical protein DPEC_G00350980 [Dallia pectoralis]|uniref:Uncharacterized protein n=1 Tax=Dallia pectoralis TaxID=75939 RepID=A0ACC2F1U6_DALPE|nr:hypothetical protein DPEC_G00350980 [Dallia pectoralis]